MATIVIVPAAFHGGWRWKEVRVGLQAAGHEVYALTLTGLGERSHLAAPTSVLDTHVQDVVNVLEDEDLREVVVLGHSYGGMVLTAVATGSGRPAADHPALGADELRRTGGGGRRGRRAAAQPGAGCLRLPPLLVRGASVRTRAHDRLRRDPSTGGNP